MVQTVLCFDRDETVDVNPHDDHDAVPLAWVKHFAHEHSDVDVWATGNQHLRTEAAICGIREARSLWEAHHERSVKPVYESRGYHSYKPSRRDGLRLIHDLYDIYTDNDPAFVVVDDADLRDMSEYTHYWPWTFVSETETDQPPVELGSVGVCNHPSQSNDCHCTLSASVSIE